MERSNEDRPIYIVRWNQRGTSTGPVVELRMSVHCSAADADLDAQRYNIRPSQGSDGTRSVPATSVGGRSPWFNVVGTLRVP